MRFNISVFDSVVSFVKKLGETVNVVVFEVCIGSDSRGHINSKPLAG